MIHRRFTARLIAPILRATGFRFSKEYRWGVTRFHRCVYFATDTIAANRRAGLKACDWSS